MSSVASSNSGPRWNPKNLEIRTLSVEKTLEPLVIQVTTLVNNKGPSNKKKGRSKRPKVWWMYCNMLVWDSEVIQSIKMFMLHCFKACYYKFWRYVHGIRYIKSNLYGISVILPGCSCLINQNIISALESTDISSMISGRFFLLTWVVMYFTSFFRYINAIHWKDMVVLTHFCYYCPMPI